MPLAWSSAWPRSAVTPAPSLAEDGELGTTCPRSADGGAVTNLSQKNLTKGVEWSRSGQRTPGC